MTDYVIMPKADYESACNAIREKTGKSDPIKSGDMATEIGGIQSGGTSDALAALCEDLKYFAYNIDADNGQIILTAYLDTTKYNEIGTRDVNIPNSIGGYRVVIASEGTVR